MARRSGDNALEQLLQRNSGSALKEKQQDGKPMPKQKEKLTRRLSTAVMEAFNPKVELQVKFGLELGPDESVLDCFACAYYPPSGLLVQGKMIVTAKYLAFRADLAVTSWGALRILLRLQDVIRLEKANTAMGVVPNAIDLSTKNHGSYFFGSFLDRDQTFYLIKSMVEVERHIVELQALALREGGDSGEDNVLPPQKPQQQLELGIQKLKPRSRAGTATTTAAAAAATASAVKPSKGSLSPPESPEAASPSSSFSSPAASVPASVPASASSEQDDVPPEDLPAEIKRLFYDSASALAPVVLLDAQLDVPLQALFRENILHCYNYCDFLTHRGEQVERSSCTEWAPLPAADAQAVALEAQAQGVAFTYSRRVRLRHQRTFGTLQGVLPSLVDSTTKQYLHIYGRKGHRGSNRRPSMGRDSFSGSGGGGQATSNLGSCRPLRCVLLSVTTCSGGGVLPLLDSFKLLTFWLLEDSAGSPHPHTHLRCCAKVLPLASLKLFSSLPSLGPSLVQHMDDGLMDRSLLTARAWVFAWVSDRTREYQKEAAGGQAALEAMSTAIGDATKAGSWSARELERVARFGRHHPPILTLQDLKREQRVDQEAKRGRNSFNLLSHMALLLLVLLAAAAAVLLQAHTNANLASQLRVLRGELDALEEGVRRRGRVIEQAQASKGSEAGVASWLSAPSLFPSSFTVTAWGSPSA